MYLTLDIIKKHLNIDDYYTDDDTYLIGLASVAERVIEKHIDNNLSNFCDSEGELKETPLLHAMLLFIGDMYQSRESVSFNSNPLEIPFSYDYLLSLYKNYSNNNNCI